MNAQTDSEVFVRRANICMKLSCAFAGLTDVVVGKDKRRGRAGVRVEDVGSGVDGGEMKKGDIWRWGPRGVKREGECGIHSNPDS